jgi:hypothetical protein
MLQIFGFVCLFLAVNFKLAGRPSIAANVVSTVNGFEIASRVLSHLHQNELSTVNKDLLALLIVDHSPVGLCYCCVTSNE